MKLFFAMRFYGINHLSEILELISSYQPDNILLFQKNTLMHEVTFIKYPGNAVLLEEHLNNNALIRKVFMQGDTSNKLQTEYMVVLRLPENESTKANINTLRAIALTCLAISDPIPFSTIQPGYVLRVYFRTYAHAIQFASLIGSIIESAYSIEIRNI